MVHFTWVLLFRFMSYSLSVFGIFFLTDQFIQIVKHQFYILAVVEEFFFDLLDFEFQVEGLGRYSSQFGKNPNYLNVHGYGTIAVQNTGQHGYALLRKTEWCMAQSHLI